MGDRSDAPHQAGVATASVVAGALLILVGAGALTAHGPALALPLVGGGVAWSATALGLRSGRDWAAPAAGILGLATAILSVLYLLVDAVASLSSGVPMRLELPVAGSLSGWTSVLVVGLIGAAGAFVTMAARPAVATATD